MPYVIGQFSPASGLIIKTDGSTVNTADAYDANGNLKVAVQSAVATTTLYKYTEYLALANNGTATLWTPASGKKIRLKYLMFFSSGAIKAHFKDGSGGTIFTTVQTHQDHNIMLDFGDGRLFDAANNILQIQNVGGTTRDIWVTAYGTEE